VRDEVFADTDADFDGALEHFGGGGAQVVGELGADPVGGEGVGGFDNHRVSIERDAGFAVEPEVIAFSAKTFGEAEGEGVDLAVATIGGSFGRGGAVEGQAGVEGGSRDKIAHWARDGGHRRLLQDNNLDVQQKREEV
jgi:hypothetical protein